MLPVRTVRYAARRRTGSSTRSRPAGLHHSGFFPFSPRQVGRSPGFEVLFDGLERQQNVDLVGLALGGGAVVTLKDGPGPGLLVIEFHPEVRQVRADPGRASLRIPRRRPALADPSDLGKLCVPVRESFDWPWIPF